MKFRYTFVVRQILILLITVGLGGPVAVAGASDVTVPKGTIKKSPGKSVKVQNAPMTAADKAQEQKITDTLRQMGFNVTGISKAANGQYNVRVNKFEAAKATNAYKGVLAFRGNVRGAARQVGAANMNRGLRNAGGADVDSIQTPTGGGGQAGGGDTDSVPTPGGGATPGGPSIGDFEGGTGGRPGGGLGPDGGGTGPGDDGTGGDGLGPDGGGIGPGDDGPGGGDTGPGNPTGPDDGGGGNPPEPEDGDDGGGSGGGDPPEQNDGDDNGGGTPTDPDDGTDRVLNRDAASRGIARGNTQINAGRTALTTGGTAVLSVTVTKAGALSISRQSLANAGLNNQVPSAANGNVMFH